jgi:TPR repeat protein
MRQRFSFSFLIVALLAPLAAALPQVANSPQQVGIKSRPQSFQWTDVRKKELVVKAQRGDASSQMWLGCAYEQGWFGEKNFPEALKWFRRSAEQGDPDAQVSLGQMYEAGEGVTQNYAIAAEWYRKAAEHVPDFGGAGQGRNDLGLLYLNGYGVPQDYVQAYVWFSLSAESNPNLQYAAEHLTPEHIREAERLASDWKIRHGMPTTRETR